MDCIFCKITQKQLPSDVLFETDKVMVIVDVNPKAPHHYLIISKAHIETVNDLTEENGDLVTEMILTARDLARQKGIEKGYKLVFNVGRLGGQVIFHLHLHLLGGWHQETHEAHI